QLTGKTNAGVLSIIVLFIIGGFLLTRVPENNTSVTPPSPKTKTL
ncbi:MFS transporter, partial [Bacillus thuringiensis]|nr:MFS transporter [Bacillus thuringiensis]